MEKLIDSSKNPLYFHWYMLELDKRNKNISLEVKKQKEKEFEDYKKDVKVMRSRSRSKSTIRKNISEKSLNIYATFTLKKDKRDKDESLVSKSFIKMLKRYNIPYVGVKEYHDDGNIHFHMFIRVDDEQLITKKIINGKEIRDKYGNKIYELIPFENNYGFTTLKYIDGKEDYQKAKIVSYLTKYIVKDKNKLMSSRYGRLNASDMAVNMFGASKVICGI
jgi:hypothetical protein